LIGRSCETFGGFNFFWDFDFIITVVCRRQIRPENIFFSILWCFWINLWSTGRHLDVYWKILVRLHHTHWLSHNKIFAGNLVLEINLTSSVAYNHGIGSLSHHTFVDRLYRKKYLRRELQPSCDDGLLTCRGFRCGFFCFAVDLHLFHILIIFFHIPASSIILLLICGAVVVLLVTMVPLFVFVKRLRM
jgi:hypothetical protein